MSSPVPHRPEPDDEPDTETLLRQLAQTLEADDKASEDWTAIRPELLKRHPNPVPRS